MKKASLKPGDLNAVLCMGGPGSFTGLRLGYSIAKGLALSLSIPFAPVPTLECIAQRQEQNITLPVIEARKNAYFYAFFSGKTRLTQDRDADVSQIAGEIKQYGEKITLTGTGAAMLYDSLPKELRENIILNYEKKGYAREIIYIAKDKRIMDNDNTVYLYSGPEYIRETDAEAALMRRVQ